MRARAAAVVLALLAAAALPAQTPAPTPTAKPKPKTARTPAVKSAKPPLDFSGIWEIDVKASHGVSPQMEGAVLSVRQNGDRIWIEPIEQKRPKLLAEEIVVDGKLYEKAVGRGQKGSLQAQWGKDDQSLWLQATSGTEENPNAGVQRMVWRLRENGNVWTRQTWTAQKDGTKETFLVFRRRAAEKKP